ncbi:hypothetical protein [Streptomyces sp. AcE210]|uniref:hypothetical protein n=1 Tax=Streptomyces sp. AcE210 TaxID=2292703 RepID=UPI001404DA30|nr:hypothetical protein [Streptomyces sp. AcE210]
MLRRHPGTTAVGLPGAGHDVHLERPPASCGICSGRYGRYMQLLGHLLNHRHQHADGWTARDIDTALYWIGKNPQANDR